MPKICYQISFKPCKNLFISLIALNAFLAVNTAVYAYHVYWRNVANRGTVNIAVFGKSWHYQDRIIRQIGMSGLDERQIMTLQWK